MLFWTILCCKYFAVFPVFLSFFVPFFVEEYIKNRSFSIPRSFLRQRFCVKPGIKSAVSVQLFLPLFGTWRMSKSFPTLSCFELSVHSYLYVKFWCFHINIFCLYAICSSLYICRRHVEYDFVLQSSEFSNSAVLHL